MSRDLGTISLFQETQLLLFRSETNYKVHDEFGFQDKKLVRIISLLDTVAGPNFVH